MVILRSFGNLQHCPLISREACVSQMKLSSLALWQCRIIFILVYPRCVRRIEVSFIVVCTCILAFCQKGYWICLCRWEALECFSSLSLLHLRSFMWIVKLLCHACIPLSPLQLNAYSSEKFLTSKWLWPLQFKWSATNLLLLLKMGTNGPVSPMCLLHCHCCNGCRL